MYPRLGSRISQPWTQISHHMLQPTDTRQLQARKYSSDARNSGNNAQQETQEEQSAAKPDSQGSGLTFGFQSLSGLFQRAPSSRYSRPRDSDFQDPLTEPVSTSIPRVGLPEEGKGLRMGSFFQASPVTEDQAAPRNEKYTLANTNTLPHSAPAKISSSFAPENRTNGLTRLSSRKFVGRDTEVKSKITATSNPPKPDQRDLHRMASAPSALYQKYGSAFVQRRSALHRRTRMNHQPEPVRPWGVSRESPMMNPSASTVSQEDQEYDGSAGQHVSAQAEASSTNAELTHVKSSGEAHMVDVGAKPHTRRVAIAFATIHFSNTAPVQLILHNNNKKGDVSAVSRIAGIMAAKRTPDLIPLCHSIAINKTDIYVKLLPPGTRHPLTDRSTKWGCVTVQAHVECNGPTGVEMEALTAASMATLTVFDMCKAVDRDMHLGAIRVVYKSGGKSGLHAYAPWVKDVGPLFFRDRDLERPRILESNESEGKEKP